jgi:hypothetical protein
MVIHNEHLNCIGSLVNWLNKLMPIILLYWMFEDDWIKLSASVFCSTSPYQHFHFVGLTSSSTIPLERHALECWSASRETHPRVFSHRDRFMPDRLTCVFLVFYCHKTQWSRVQWQSINSFSHPNHHFIGLLRPLTIIMTRGYAHFCRRVANEKNWISLKILYCGYQ